MFFFKFQSDLKSIILFLGDEAYDLIPVDVSFIKATHIHKNILELSF